MKNASLAILSIVILLLSILLLKTAREKAGTQLELIEATRWRIQVESAAQQIASSRSMALYDCHSPNEILKIFENRPDVEVVGLEATFLDLPSIATLTTLPNLKRLLVAGGGMRKEEDWLLLKHLKSLRTLDLNTTVTPEMLAKLQKELPDCQIQ